MLPYRVVRAGSRRPGQSSKHVHVLTCILAESNLGSVVGSTCIFWGWLDFISIL